MNDYNKQKIVDTTRASFAQVIKRNGVVQVQALILVETEPKKFEQIRLNLTKNGYEFLNEKPKQNPVSRIASWIKAQ